MVVVVYCENQATRSEGSVSYHFPQESVPEPEECDAGDVSCFEAAEMNQQQQQHQTKQFLNHTEADKGLKQASKETDDRDNDDEEAETENDDEEDNDAPLLKWLTERAVPDVKTCGIYLAPSTIPGAGLGMFAGRTYKRSEIVTEGDIVIPLSEIDWHNGFNLPQFLWEEYTWSYVSTCILFRTRIFLWCKIVRRTFLILFCLFSKISTHLLYLPKSTTALVVSPECRKITDTQVVYRLALLVSELLSIAICH